MASTCYLETDPSGEPSLDEIFAEPIIQLIMKRDGVEPSHMRGALDRVLRKYAEPELVQ